MMMLIGVHGRARAGKDHAANYLARNMMFYKYAFAEPLKTMLKSVFGDHFHEGDRSGICPETGKSYREMMQTLGTEWGRNLMHPQMWVNLVDRKYREVAEYCPMAKGMVLSDVRFDSEAEWIQQNGGVILDIVRPVPRTVKEKIKAAVGLQVGIPGHQSEQGISQHYITHTIRNDGTLVDFDIKLMGLVDELLGR
jgi:hypothetical protein